MTEYGGKSATIMCCSSCNTKCNHCYINYTGNINENDLFEMVELLSKKYSVSLNGTELLLNKGYLKSLVYINQDRVLTNGLVIYNNPQLLLELRESGIEWICMSYHFDLHSIVSSVDSKIVFQNIKMIKELGMKLEIMTTISKSNFSKILSIVEQAISMNVDCIRFTNYFTSGNAKKLNSDNFLLSDTEIEDFFDQFYLAKALYSKDILIRRSGLFDRDMRKKNSSYYCPAGENNVAITPDLKVYPCPFLVEDGYDIGKYENGHILIEKEFNYDHSRCLTHSVFNRGKVLERKNDK